MNSYRIVSATDYAGKTEYAVEIREHSILFGWHWRRIQSSIPNWSDAGPTKIYDSTLVGCREYISQALRPLPEWSVVEEFPAPGHAGP